MNIQKYLGWVQRYLFAIEQGPLPEPRLSLTIDHDWPLEYKRISFPYTTIAGIVTPLVYSPGNESHGLVFSLSSFKTAAGFWLATEGFFGLNYVDRTGVAHRMLTHQAGLATIDPLPLIRDSAQDAVTTWKGIEPVYVEPGASLQYLQQSVAGGENGIVIGLVLERLKSYPLRLP